MTKKTLVRRPALCGGALVVVVVVVVMVRPRHDRASPPLGRCPESSRERIPRHVFYTGKVDSRLRMLTDANGSWPADFGFSFFSDGAMRTSMKHLDAELAKTNNVTGAYDAFESLRNWALRADLWRYAILWACGGIYVDAKMKLTADFGAFYANALSSHDDASLMTCADRYLTRRDAEPLPLWQGFLMAAPRSPDLAETLRLAIANVQRRSYDVRVLAITGPRAIGAAVRPGLDKGRVAIVCDQVARTETITTPFLRLNKTVRDNPLLFVEDKALHDDVRGGTAHSYSAMYRARDLYHTARR
ncbi:hypothetical protein CTAYLR_005792 [Chrysophaeum taylorii]|uniref:Uncharacterized protein n=1 Tax=Chrysophaeum taylorii TaxID=2483200 RepID=A0AAD7UN92_9STRA|nr:hypothetical protein CTAYLR_005792 [Chrysophaeum taylorii]